MQRGILAFINPQTSEIEFPDFITPKALCSNWLFEKSESETEKQTSVL